VSVPKAISDRRDHDRIHSISLEIVLDGIRYPAIDWSLGGVLVANYYGVRTLGDEIHGSFRICSDMNSPTGGQLALEFLSLSFRAITVLEAFMTGRSRA
jgi:hypothetical protein